MVAWMPAYRTWLRVNVEPVAEQPLGPAEAGPLPWRLPAGVGRSSCRYTVSVTWLLAWPTSRAIFSIAMSSSDSSETNVCRRSRGAQSRPNPALSQTSWNILRMCLAPSGVPVAVMNTLPVSCQCVPAASRSAAWSTCHSLSVPDGHLRQLQRMAGPRGLRVPRPDPRAAPPPTEDRRPGRRPAPIRSPGLPPGALQPSGSQRCRHAAARPDAADPSALYAAPPKLPYSPVVALGEHRPPGLAHARDHGDSRPPKPAPGQLVAGAVL